MKGLMACSKIWRFYALSILEKVTCLLNMSPLLIDTEFYSEAFYSSAMVTQTLSFRIFFLICLVSFMFMIPLWCNTSPPFTLSAALSWKWKEDDTNRRKKGVVSAVWQALPTGFFNHSCFIRWLLLPFCIFLWRRWRRQRDGRQSVSLRCNCGVSVWLQLFGLKAAQRIQLKKKKVCLREHVVCLVQVPNWPMTNGCCQIR